MLDWFLVTYLRGAGDYVDHSHGQDEEQYHAVHHDGE